MNYADIKRIDSANGPGVRVSLFVSGCTRHCKGCFNKETWDFNYGQPFTEETIELILSYLNHEYIKGLTVLGGEPFEHRNQIGLLPLLKRVKECYPDKTIWCFSGYDFEKDILGKMVKEWTETKEMLSYLDMLVDGKFMEDLKNVNLQFKGSSNQRTILVQESLKAEKVILWNPIPYTQKIRAERSY